MTQERISEKDQFDLEWKNLLSPSGNNSLFLPFIRARLKQFHLDQVYTETDIINEVYLRGVKTFQKGKVIESFSGWIRGTALNYIRELNREKFRLMQLEDYHLDEEKKVKEAGKNLIEMQEEELQSKLELLSLALKKVNSRRTKVIELQGC